MPTDPRLLSEEALLARHEQLHRVMEQALTQRQLSIACLHHELVRVAMFITISSREHSRDEHDTPINYDDMSPRAQAALRCYEAHTYCNQYPGANLRPRCQPFYDELWSRFT